MATTKDFDELGPWHEMLEQGRLKRVPLRQDSFLKFSDRNVRKQYLKPAPKRKKGEKGKPKPIHRYYDDPIPGDPLAESTLFVYEPGRHKPKGGHKVEIAGVYLKKVIHPDIWREALTGLKAMAWEPPERPETFTAIERQRGRVAAGELQFIHTHRGSFERRATFKTEGHNLARLEPLLKLVDLIFAVVLPAYWLLQSNPKTLAERKRIMASPEKPRHRHPATGTPTWDP